MRRRSRRAAFHQFAQGRQTAQPVGTSVKSAVTRRLMRSTEDMKCHRRRPKGVTFATFYTISGNSSAAVARGEGRADRRPTTPGGRWTARGRRR